MFNLKTSLILKKFIIISFILAVNATLDLLKGPFSDIINKLEGSSESSSSEGVDFISSDGVTLPGTKWCGPGDTAENYDDLGEYIETDMCCRDHDNCDDILYGGEEGHGLKNDDWFTRLSCSCDRQFFNCLHKANDSVSNFVGTQYFYFRNKCFMNAHPIVGCEDYQESLFAKRCVQYDFDKNQPKMYQWLDLPFYDAEKFPKQKMDRDMFLDKMSQHQNFDRK